MESEQAPYTALADIYDQVMSHVDYETWADYLYKLIAEYAPRRPSVLELGCGTGELARRLAPALGGSYVASDYSPQMLAVAKKKLSGLPNVTLERLDFRQLSFRETVDVVLLTYDGINYALDETALRETLSRVWNTLKPGGLFLFDESTPANSINNLSYFDDEFVGGDVSYSRSSSYDERTRIHETRFLIRKGKTVASETHQQRAFTRFEMSEAFRATDFEVICSLRAFEFEAADGATERIQWVLRRPLSTDKMGEA